MPGINNGGVANYLTLGVRVLCSLLVLSLRGVQFPSAERVGSAEAQRKQVKQARSRSLRRKIRMISAPNGGCYWLVLPCPLHRWLRVCLVPAELRVSVWCQLGTDARDSLYLALNGRMLRARYTSPAFRTAAPCTITSI